MAVEDTLLSTLTRQLSALLQSVAADRLAANQRLQSLDSRLSGLEATVRPAVVESWADDLALLKI